MRSCPTLKREVLQYPSITEDRNLQSMTTPSVVPGYRFAFTVNHYTESDIADVMTFASQCKYVIFGKEIAESGTPHLQGFLITKATTRLSKLKKVVPRAHWENAKKCNDANVKYCKKQGDFTEIGQLPQSKGQAQVDIWQAVRRLAEAGDFDAIPDNMYIRYKRTLQEIHREKRPKPQPRPVLDNHWWFGPTRVGKTSTAKLENPDYYLKTCDQWWDGYNDEACVIIDEWSPDNANLAQQLKLWSDHGEFRAAIKGGHMLIRPAKIIVCSNYSMEECFPRYGDLEPLKARFQVREWKKSDDAVRSESFDFSGEF